MQENTPFQDALNNIFMAESERKKKKKSMNLRDDDLEIIRKTIRSKNLILNELIGCGGFACVYRVTSTQYNQSFALKIFIRDFGGSCRSLMSFKTERQALISLDHPNIIKAYDSFCDDRFFYLLLEYCPYGTLKSLKAPLNLNQFKVAAVMMTRAVSYLHSKEIVHSDIKPNNFLIDQNHRIKLCDFGLIQQMTKEKSKIFAGSKPYMSPELVTKTPYDPRKADVWALGISFYYLLTKKLPWHTNDLARMNVEIVQGLIQFPSFIDNESSKLIYNMLSSHPASRPLPNAILKCSLFAGISNQEKLRFNFTNLFCSNNSDQPCKKNITSSNSPDLSNVHSIEHSSSKSGENKMSEINPEKKQITSFVSLTRLPLLSQATILPRNNKNKAVLSSRT